MDVARYFPLENCKGQGLPIRGHARKSSIVNEHIII